MKMPLNPNPLEARQPGSGVAPTQGAQGATGVGATAGDRRDLDISPPDPEVTEAKPRRRFTAAYKLRVIDQADQCSEPGQIGALLRREGLYSSHLTNWRKQREQGILQGLTPAKRGRKARPRNPLDTRVAELERENQRLQNKLKQAHIIIEAQKKISEILSIEQSL
jgi:transposase-like protein